MGSVETNLTRIHEGTGLIPGSLALLSRLRIWCCHVVVSYGVGFRHSLVLALLWLWCRPAAIVPIPPLAWVLLYATGAALKRQKKKEDKLS